MHIELLRLVLSRAAPGLLAGETTPLLTRAASIRNAIVFDELLNYMRGSGGNDATTTGDALALTLSEFAQVLKGFGAIIFVLFYFLFRFASLV